MTYVQYPISVQRVPVVARKTDIPVLTGWSPWLGAGAASHGAGYIGYFTLSSELAAALPPPHLDLIAVCVAMATETAIKSQALTCKSGIPGIPAGE